MNGAGEIEQYYYAIIEALAFLMVFLDIIWDREGAHCEKWEIVWIILSLGAGRRILADPMVYVWAKIRERRE